MNNPPTHEIHYLVLKALEQQPGISQRELAATLGVSLGKTNYVVRELIKRGWVKMDNFRRSDNKRAYAYILTPAGLVSKAKITSRFLHRKREEYRQLRAEIADLEREVSGITSD